MEVAITDPHLRVSLLMHLIERLDRGELGALLESGVCPKSLDKLRQLEMSSLIRLGAMRQPEIHFSLNSTGLDFGLQTIERQNNEIVELVYFIQNGASLSMLNQFFPAQDIRVIQTYRKLLTNERKTGRTALPDENTRDLIHQSWHAMGEEYPDISSLRERLMLLHGFFNDYSLDVLYATVNEFESQEK